MSNFPLRMRSDLDFLEEAMKTAVEVAQNVLNVPILSVIQCLSNTRRLSDALSRLPKAPTRLLSTHCHDDLGLAVANSLAAVSAGARQIECCVNGLGERVGNAALEEIVMALRTRKDLMDIETRLDTKKITSVSAW